MMSKKLTAKLAVYAMLVLLALFALVPLLWLFSSALRPPQEVMANPLGMPTRLYFGNLVKAWTVGRFGLYLRNSALTTLGGIAVCLPLAILMAYALTWLHLPGEKVLTSVLMVGMMVPTQALMVPLFFELRSMGLINSFWGVILPLSAFELSFATFMLRGFFKDIPVELIDAARVDGANTLQILYKIIIPIATPAIFSLTVLMFMHMWNAFVIALLVLQKESIRTAPLALMYFKSRESMDWALTAAAVLLLALPVMIVYLMLQRRFERGIASGFSKG